MKSLMLGVMLSLPVVVGASMLDEMYEGTYIWGEDVTTFKPCGHHETYWVSVSSWVFEPLKQYYEANVTEPYTAIYLQFRGHLLNEQVGGFASAYDGLIRVSEVKFRSTEIPADCK